jgi:hypothetical protein
MKVRKVKKFEMYFIFSKAQIVFWSWEGMGIISLARVSLCSF